MSLVALEGPEGAGKTALARALVEHHGYAKYRALAPAGAERLTARELSYFQVLGIPIGTFAEDLYPVDVLAQLRRAGCDFSMVLDRCMISGLAYSDLPAGSVVLRALLREWRNLFNEAGGKLVHLTCNIQTSIARLPEGDERRNRGHQAMVRERYNIVMDLLPPDFPMITIATDNKRLEHVLQQVLSNLE